MKVISGSSYGFNEPDAVISDGTHVWVVSYGDSVTELSASTGALVKVISGSSYGFNEPGAIASDGTHSGWRTPTASQSPSSQPPDHTRTTGPFQPMEQPVREGRSGPRRPACKARTARR